MDEVRAIIESGLLLYDHDAETISINDDNIYYSSDNNGILLAGYIHYPLIIDKIINIVTVHAVLNK